MARRTYQTRRPLAHAIRRRSPRPLGRGPAPARTQNAPTAQPMQRRAARFPAGDGGTPDAYSRIEAAPSYTPTRLVKEGDVMINLLWALAAVFVVFWVLGLSFHVGGGLIHVLLVLAIISILVRVITGRRIA